MSSPGHNVERAYVQSRLDQANHELEQATASMQADLARLTESWSSGFERQLAESETRLAEIRDETSRFIASLYDGDESAHTDVAQGLDASPAGGSSPANHGGVPGQPSQHELELARAREIKDMDMATYARVRSELGVRSATDMTRLFSQERP